MDQYFSGFSQTNGEVDDDNKDAKGVCDRYNCVTEKVINIPPPAKPTRSCGKCCEPTCCTKKPDPGKVITTELDPEAVAYPKVELEKTAIEQPPAPEPEPVPEPVKEEPAESALPKVKVTVKEVPAGTSPAAAKATEEEEK